MTIQINTPRDAKAVGASPMARSAGEAPIRTGGDTPQSAEYYILCPQRPDEVPGLITHLISRDICEKRQVEHYHKCENCIRARVWRQRNGLPV